MKIAFRTDASVEIGTGHVMRCLTLAEELRSRGNDCIFISRKLPGNLCDLIATKGFLTLRLPNGKAPDWQVDAANTGKALAGLGGTISWLVVDHYGLDRRWEQALRQSASRIMVIDDLANRPHDCDVLLDQNLYNDRDRRYDGLIPAECRRLLGPAFALLRPQFLEARQTAIKRDGSINRILIFFGGTDPTGETEKTLDAFQLLAKPNIELDVVVGMSNPKRETIKSRCTTMQNTTFHCQIDDMAMLMARADLAIGAGGTTTWERCCLGLPSLIIAVAPNQEAIAEAVARAGAAEYLGTTHTVTVSDIHVSCENLFQQKKHVAELAVQAFNLVDGDGTKTVTSVLQTQFDQKRTILLLGPPRQELMDFLGAFGDDIRTSENPLSADSIILQNVDFIISYGYRHILKKEVLDKYLNRAVNLHVSLLPWNKGADPNLWSILDDTPKGVTVHYMNEQLDNGNIVIQQEVNFGPDDTLQTSYTILSRTILSLFREVWPSIRAGDNVGTPMPPGGSYHSLRDRKTIEYLLTKGWDTPIRDLIGMAKRTL